jgi:hypothetical protein
VRDGALVITGPFEQMRTDGIEAIMPSHSRVGVERLQ